MSATRTWKCPQCGVSLEIGYDWLAERGGPVCEHCDCDMDLQPAGADNGKLAAELLEIGSELLEWANTMGGWEAKCWTRLRTAMKTAAAAHEQADGSPETAPSEEQIETAWWTLPSRGKERKDGVRNAVIVRPARSFCKRLSYTP